MKNHKKQNPKKPARALNKKTRPRKPKRTEPSDSGYAGVASFLTDKREWRIDLRGHFTNHENVDIPVGRWFYVKAVKRVERHIMSSALFMIPTPEEGGRNDWGERDVDDPNLVRIFGSGLCVCPNCGQEPEFVVNVDGRSAITTTECDGLAGLAEHSVSFDVPSGKLVFANDLRDYYPVNASYDLMGDLGCKRTSESYAAHGMFHFFVGNTCPGIYQSGDRISIGSPARPYGIDDEDIEDEADDLPVEPHGMKKGSVCTDLWWYSAADYDDLRSRMGDKFEELINDGFTTVVDVTPGHYRAVGRNHLVHREQARIELLHVERYRLNAAMTKAERDKAKKTLQSNPDELDNSYYGVARLALEPIKVLKDRLAITKQVLRYEYHRAPQFELRSYIERVGDCNGVNPHFEAESARQEAPSFEDYIKIARLAWPTIFPTRQAILDHTFLTIGNGMRWHRGTLYTTSSEMENARERLAAGAEVSFEPVCDEPTSYYPISERYSAIFNVPDDVRPDWLGGVFETLEMVLKTDPDYKDDHRDNKLQHDLATKAYGQLVLRFGYPDRGVNTGGEDGSGAQSGD